MSAVSPSLWDVLVGLAIMSPPRSNCVTTSSFLLSSSPLIFHYETPHPQSEFLAVVMKQKLKNVIMSTVVCGTLALGGAVTGKEDDSKTAEDKTTEVKISQQEDGIQALWVGEWVSRLNGYLWIAYADGRMEYESPMGRKSKQGKGTWEQVGKTIEVNWAKIGIDVVTIGDDGRIGQVVVKKKPTMKYTVRRLK